MRVELTMSDLQSDALATWLRRRHSSLENYEIRSTWSSAGLLRVRSSRQTGFSLLRVTLVPVYRIGLQRNLTKFR